MSLLGKKWIVRDEQRQRPLVESLLRNRGIEDRDRFLKPDWNRDLHDPYLMEDMQKVVDRLRVCRHRDELVMVVGDYDIDGISGTALLYEALQKLGIRVIARIPHRIRDGYGLNLNIVLEAQKAGVGVIITVDNGISCAAEVDAARSCNIDVIITDHHTIPEIYPYNAYAILHPKKPGTIYPFHDLAGVGVAFKLVSALAAEFFPDEAEVYLKWCLDLVVLGTVADCSDLKGENRTLTKFGLKVLMQTRRIGLRELLKISGQDLSRMSTETIGFRIAPRLNAAGRLDDATVSLQLLLTNDEREARLLAEKLHILNQKRQKITGVMMEIAEAQLASRLDREKILIAKDTSFHAGVVGLVAGKLAEKYNRPVIILEDRGDLLTASARSIASFNILHAILKQKHLLSRFGGHAQAAGFSMKPENYEEFRHNMEESVRADLSDEQMRPVINIDCAVEEHEVCRDTIGFLRRLEPFGIGNERPTFLLKGTRLVDVKRVGSDSSHLRLTLQRNGHHMQAIGFHMGKFMDELSRDLGLDIVFHLAENDWQGVRSIQLEMMDMKLAASA